MRKEWGEEVVKDKGQIYDNGRIFDFGSKHKVQMICYRINYTHKIYIILSTDITPINLIYKQILRQRSS